MTRAHSGAGFLLGFGLSTGIARAEAPFNPDRPGFSDSTGVVPQGALMTEVGALLSAQASGATLGGPALLIRGGLTRHLELRVTAPDLLLPLSGEGATVSVGSTGLGLKGALSVGDVGASLVAMVPVSPAGALADGLGAPTLGVNVAGPAGEVYGWGANAVLGLDADSPSWAGSASLGRGVGESGGAYVQAALLGGGGAVSPLAGAGGTLMLLPALQLDLYVDVLPTDGAVNVGAGLARQW